MKTKYKKYKEEEYPLWSKITSAVLVILLIVFAFFTLSFNLMFEFHPVYGTSMMPTLNANETNEDGVYVFKTKKFKRGDIIIINSPVTGNMVVKRLLGLGGDKLKVSAYDDNGETKYQIELIKKGETKITLVRYEFKNGITESSFYNDFYEPDSRKTFDENDASWIVVPEGKIFFVGDNQSSINASDDSCDYGPVSINSVFGKVKFVIFERQNYLGQIIEQIFNPYPLLEMNV